MSNVAKYVLADDDRDLILDAFDQFSGSKGVFARKYVLDAHHVHRWARGDPMSRLNYDRMTKFANDLRRDFDGTARAAGIVEIGFGADINAMLGVAKDMTEDRHFTSAMSVLLHAFQQLSQKRALETAVEILPQILYTGYRFCKPEVFLDQVRQHVLPKLLADNRRCLADDLLRHTCASQVACAANEIGDAVVAEQFFANETRVRALLGHRRVPAWLESQLRRNHAHYWVWHDPGRKAFDRALGLLNEAHAVDPSQRNAYSTAHCRCDMFLSLRDYPRAWEAIGPYYLQARDALSKGNIGGPDIPILQRYAILLHGTVARSASAAQDYRREEHLRDIATLQHWLNVFGGRLESGFTYELQVEDTWAFDELRIIVSRSRQRQRSGIDTSPLRDLAQRLA